VTLKPVSPQRSALKYAGQRPALKVTFTRSALKVAMVSGVAASQAASLASEASADEAAASAAAALVSQNAAASSASAALTSENNAETAETNAETAQGLAEAAQTAAEAAQTAAELAETNAETAASTATTQAGIATTQAGLAATSAGNAETAETNAETAETNAEIARDAALAAQAAAEAAAASLDLPTIAPGDAGKVLTVNVTEDGYDLETPSATGVTSVDASVPTGFSVSGGPITTTGTLAITYTAGYQGYTSAEAALVASALQPGDIGSTVQAYDAQLADVAGLAVTDGNFIVGNGTNFVAESGATARSSLGITEGAWTPTLTFATPGDLSVSYATQDGRYIKIGTTVTAWCNLQCTPTHTTASGAAMLDGLPFTVSDPAAGYPFQHSANLNYPTGATALLVATSPGTTQANVRSVGDNFSQAVVASDMATGQVQIFRLCVTYRTTA